MQVLHSVKWKMRLLEKDQRTFFRVYVDTENLNFYNLETFLRYTFNYLKGSE